ncbi:MAG: hypothetical protein H5T42_05710 [Methanothrix sp.]|jgi:hypothetical protein|uniref:Uncharacterized protein n=1 Tax=Methanothrix thermoacetophila (strain DSM 6194 / JCM 14653 / NBRC 101360 / PT) TaxID=349307 RepID=A0B5A2_METTP|nr:hypothetical protein [Methanothrix thermoacetophila]ABK13876.1 hypothetical protein Mthe_0074 [Methanothrix thermoacetophila PT]MBC7079949.1 hypothetical protein [Methanothrix sp.]
MTKRSEGVTYDFLLDLKRLTDAYRGFETRVSALEALAIAIAIYIIFIPLGLVAYFRFYWSGTLLEHAPVVVSFIFGVILSHIIRRRRRTSVFDLFEEELSEKLKAAYDNRFHDSIVMRSLAQDLGHILSGISGRDIIDTSRLYKRVLLVFVMLALAVVVSTSISEEITPANLGVVGEIKDLAEDLLSPKQPVSEIRDNVSIYGKPSLAVLSETRLELELYPGSGVGSRAKPTETSERLFREGPPGQGVAVPSEVYIESLPPKHREIIRRYFTLLNEVRS